MRPAALLGVLLALTGATSSAQTPVERRCARRLMKVLSQPSASFDVENPQKLVRTWLGDARFIRQFSFFINARFNAEPVADADLDTLVRVVPHVMNAKRPWRDVFVGRFKFAGKTITDDPAAPALGFFADPAWLKRYQGNEVDGLLLSGAYRTLQNTTGLVIHAAANNAQGDATATGRERAECRACHFDSPYALDKVAQLLPRRVGLGDTARVVSVPVRPQQLFDGVEVRDQEALVKLLVDSEAFTFWSCRLAFEFVYGRPEHACEAPLFDRCTAAFEATGRMEDALASLLEDPSFCEVGP